MSRRSVRLRAWSVLFLVTAAARVGAEPIAPADQDDWYVVKLQGQRCGFAHMTMRREGDDVVSSATTRMSVGRADSTVKIEMEQAYRETLDGRPLSFTSRMGMGQVPMLFSGAIRDGRLTLTTEQFGVKKKATYDFDPEIRFAWGQELEQRKRGLKDGTTFTVKTYDPMMRADGAIEVEMVVHGKETVDVDGKKERLTRVTAEMQLQTRLTTDTWVDDEARPVVTVMNMGGLSFTMYRSTKEEALKEASPPEFFFNTFIQTDRRIESGAQGVTLRLRVPAEQKEGLPDIPDTGMQTFRRVSRHEGLLTVRRLDWDKLRRAPASEAKPDGKLAPYLRSSSTLDLEDKRIRRLAKKAVKECKTPAEQADALRRFVTEYIEDKNLDVGFATASEVARTRQGDCSEHGVLLAALGRAAGLPSRGVSGIVQIPPGELAPEKGAAFGYHMWTQVYFGGQWVDIDAAFRQTECDPTHVALALMPLNDEGMIDSLVSLVPLLGRLKIDVVEVKP